MPAIPENTVPRRWKRARHRYSPHGAAAERRAGGWESHALEHEISAHHSEVTHGAGLAVILPAWMRYVWPAHPERFLSFAKDVFGLMPEDDTREANAVDRKSVV